MEKEKLGSTVKPYSEHLFNVKEDLRKKATFGFMTSWQPRSSTFYGGTFAEEAQTIYPSRCSSIQPLGKVFRYKPTKQFSSGVPLYKDFLLFQVARIHGSPYSFACKRFFSNLVCFACLCHFSLTVYHLEVRLPSCVQLLRPIVRSHAGKRRRILCRFFNFPSNVSVIDRS